jgi:hypothetical protein
MVTDAQGRFESDSLPGAGPFSIQAEGYSEIPEVELAIDGDKEVVVALRSQGLIRGRVVDAATGKPIPRFTVRLTFTSDPRQDDPSAGLRSELSDPGQEFASPKGEFVTDEMLAEMPLQVMVIADGYRRQVLRRVVARVASEADAVEFRLQPENPGKLVSVRGKLVNQRGAPVRGAELRLLVATERPAERNAFPFNWDMIESGQVDLTPNVLQLQRATTGADGTFVFQRVPGDAEIELVYWGKGVPAGRIDRIEAMPEKERTSLLVTTPAPARVVGTIDRKAFPEVSSIMLSGASRFFQSSAAADKKSFTFDDLPAGNYELQVYGSRMFDENKPGAFTITVIARRSVTIEAGMELKVEMGERDRMRKQP